MYHQLQKRNINISGLFSAEQAVMYALLGDTNLDDARLTCILQSIAECAGRPNPYDAFINVASQCVFRNINRNLFETWRRQQQQQQQHQHQYKSSTRRPDAQAEAKAYLLAQRIVDRRTIPKQLNVDDMGWSYIMLWCAHFVLKQAPDLNQHHSQKRQQQHIQDFWTNVRHAASNDAIWSVPDHVMSHVCHHDFIIMDRYLAVLLLALSKGNERAAEASRRIVSLAETRGYVVSVCIFNLFLVRQWDRNSALSQLTQKQTS